MKRTTIMLPYRLKDRASRFAKKRGISLGELIRDSLEATVANAQKSLESDPLFADKAVFKGKTPSDLSKNHDRYLYVDKI